MRAGPASRRRRQAPPGGPAERLPQLLAIHPDATLEPEIEPPASRARAWERDAAIAELVRGRLCLTGPVTAEAMADSLGVTVRDIDAALLALESEGVVLRGRFTPQHPAPSADGMVRSGAAGAHPSLHAQPAARRDRAGQPGRLHALPVQVAARRSERSADRTRRAARNARARSTASSWRRGVGASGAAGASRRLRAVDARHALPGGRSRLGAAVASAAPT